MRRQAGTPLLSRRDFLRRLGLLATTVAALPLVREVQALGKTDAPLRFIIVGAGLAGLCAAYELEQLGHHCVILEAETKHIWVATRSARNCAIAMGV